MKHKVYKPVLAWLSVLLLLLLAACGGGTGPDFSNQEGVEVNIFAGLGSTSSSSVETSDLETQGVPSNPETGETGVDSAELEVFSGDTQLFFSDGRIVDEGEGEAVTLTPDDSDVSLFLPQGSYRFALTALDDQGNVLAQGETEQQVDEDSRVSIPLVSLIGSARFEVPESIKGNQVFDAFVRVSPPGREDLEVALGDFTVAYEVKEPSVQLEGSSNIGVRVAAACDVVEVTATIDNDLSDTVTANATVPVNDPTCEGTGTDVGTDLVSPYVSINTPQADATLNKSFTLQGDVNDQQSGIDKVEVYEGTVKLGDATVDTDNRSWSFDASLDDGSYTLIAVAFDKAGNSSRAEVNVSVKEGSGNEVDNCTSPVEIPDEVLRKAIKDTLRLAQNADLTCQNLESLKGFSYDIDDSSAAIESIEGLQYAVNLGILSLAGNSIEDLSPLSNLTNLFDLNLFNNQIIDISALQNLTGLEFLRLRENSVTDISVLEKFTELDGLDLRGAPVTDLSPLVRNTGLSGSTEIELDLPGDTCPEAQYLADIEALEARGIPVNANIPENCNGEGGNGGDDGDDGDDNGDNGGDDNGGDDGDNAQTCSNPVNVPDANLRRRLENVLALDPEEAISCETLARLGRIFGIGYNEDSSLNPISSLEGLQFATDLTKLSLERYTIEDYTAISNLTKLQVLRLDTLAVSSLEPLRNLTALYELKINGLNKEGAAAEAEDTLAGLVNLRNLSITNYGLADITALENLTTLERLDLSANMISDLTPLQNLTRVYTFSLSNNQISNLAPLQNLTEIRELYLQGNQISDLSGLQNLDQLGSLDLRDNQISDLTPLQNLGSLSVLELSNNPITDISPLVDSEVLGRDYALIYLQNTSLETCPGTDDRADIDALIERGLRVVFDPPTNCDGDGDGDNGQTCSNPVNIPDQGLRAAILLYLRVDDAESGTITCENLARLFELRLNPLDSGSVDNLEGLQYAVNLEEFFTTDVTFSADELAPIRNLTNLKKLDLTLLENEEDNFSFLENLSGLESLSLSSLASERLEEDVVRPTVELNQLQNLTNLKGLSLDSFTLNDLSPLVNNTGLGEGDRVNFINSSLEACPGTDGRANIDSLIERGVEVNFNEPESCQN